MIHCIENNDRPDTLYIFDFLHCIGITDIYFIRQNPFPYHKLGYIIRMCLVEVFNNIPIIRNRVLGKNNTSWINDLSRNEQNRVINSNDIFLSGRPENNRDNERNLALFQFSNQNQNTRLPFSSTFDDSYSPHQNHNNHNNRQPNQFNPSTNRRNDFQNPDNNRYSRTDHFKR